MDLSDYELAKFELASILRSAAVVLREERPELSAPFSDLFARLAEDRFNLMVVGRFSRGKSSLMNAMLHTESLPTGIIPLTSVITTVSYGSTERAFIEHEGWSLSKEIPLDALSAYVTQQGNPANEKQVALARVELPAELLRRGFHFVDSPGLGSAIADNTRMTERFLPQADAFMLVTSFDSPLSGEEFEIVRRVAGSSSRVFLVINKRDMVTADEQCQVLRHVEDQAHAIFRGDTPRIFSVSARDAIEATRTQDATRWEQSGVPELIREIGAFLVVEKHERVLVRMCARVAQALHTVPNSRDQFERLQALRGRLEAMRTRRASVGETVSEERSTFIECTICDRVKREMYDHLCQYQYEIATRHEVQLRLAERSGLCAFHTWQYEAVASDQGICLGFPPLLERISSLMHKMATVSDKECLVAELTALKPSSDRCELCEVSGEIEHASIAELVGDLSRAYGTGSQSFPGLCLRHLELVVRSMDSEEAIRNLIRREARLLQLLSDDMRRYALKHDGIRRHLASSEEAAAARRTLMIVAGHRNVGG